MSAIFGMWWLDGRPIDRVEVERMGELLAPRGPDGGGTWSEGPVAVGQRVLQANSGSRAASSPVVDAETGLVLAADVRLDNRSDLLGRLGRTCPASGDEALLLAAYARWGDACVERLIGDFAFAVWDPKRETLFCARDHFGVKPLYYCHRPSVLFAFASEVDALLSLNAVEDEIDELEVARHLLVPVGTDMAATYYRSVRRALPAQTVAVSGRGLTTRAYWNLDPKRELILGSDHEYAEALRASFLEAVGCRLPGAGPLGSMLSGGIDSSSVTCAAALLREESGASDPLHTLSAVYPRVPKSDEREYIDAVLERHRAVAHFFEADAVSPFGEIDRINRHVGGANWGPTLYITWVLYGVAADAGCRVVLNGFDGDATLSMGGAYLPELAYAGRWWKLARETTAYARRNGHPVVRSNLAMLRFGLRRRGKGANRWPSGRRGADPGAGQPEGRSAGELVASRDLLGRVEQHVGPGPDPPRTERESHRRLLLGQALAEGLSWNEACGGGRSIEARFPFMDVRLAELCLSFPPDQKLRRGWTRYAMRRAMEGILPPKIQWRPGKTNLHPGWLVAYQEEDAERVSDLLKKDDRELAAFLDLDRLRSLHERRLAGPIRLGDERALWRGVSLALWLDGRRRARATSPRFRHSSSISPRSSNSLQ
jgi:asparagine synthase (glutamine-hydrolysing)